MLQLLINIDVDDLQTAIDFYTRAFDLRVGRRFGAVGAEILGAAAPIYLLVKDADSKPFSGATHTRDYQRHWTPVHLDIVVQDIDAALEQATAAGAVKEGEVKTSNWGKLALLVDPFGNGLCLVQFLGRGYDEIAS